VLLLDNKDSFVFNLAQAFETLGEAVAIARSDRIAVGDIVDAAPKAVVLSPGPGRPEDAGVCVAAVQALPPRIPLLGVCLGHQAIAVAFGARVVRGAPCHGKTSAVHHGGSGLFRGLPSPFLGCRYHSLRVEESSVPASLEVDSRTADGVLMSLRHRQWPTFGLQFHPESFRTEHGLAVLRNFLECAR
jgi:anthranilate synthase/aminodeoxychorismate synthase-like glutamine amidotransferase